MTSTLSPTAAAAFSDQLFDNMSFAAVSPQVWNNLLQQDFCCGQFQYQLNGSVWDYLATMHRDCLPGICALEILFLTFLQFAVHYTACFFVKMCPSHLGLVSVRIVCSVVCSRPHFRLHPSKRSQCRGSHYILVLKFKDFSRVLEVYSMDSITAIFNIYFCDYRTILVDKTKHDNY